MNINRVVLIIGGARSGKSTFALKEASRVSGKKAYIATAEALDEEMHQRIEDHKRQRGDDWVTYEEPIKIAEVIKEIKDKYGVIVIDCLTLWLSNLLTRTQTTEEEIKKFLEVLHCFKNSPVCALSSGFCTLFVVSNEVGMGIVPDNEMTRRFRDIAGLLNQKIAVVSDKVYLLVAGIPVKIKDDTGNN